MYIQTVLEGDKWYAQFYDRILNKPQEAVYQTVPEGMNLLQSELAIIQIEEGTLKSHFKSNPFWQQKVKTFAKERASYQANIFPKNSPLVPFFKVSNILKLTYSVVNISI